ncbi:YggS family pyridoxal phosphate enzyme [Paenibacillus sp. 32O-W]|nr:YggS family pyridoxal phosphate enzyme [Paenibacillus sp. 32O-W]
MKRILTLQDRLDAVERRLQAACARSGRSREEVRIIAVTKYVGTATVLEALRCGIRHLGENRWQQAEPKWRAISGPDAAADYAVQAVWHFIGSLQSNKVKDVIDKFTYIHSLDRMSLAQAIDRHAARLGIVVPCFVQVNVSGEQSKHGLAPEETEHFLKELAAFRSIRPIGLMTMAPHEEDPEATRPVFRQLRLLRDELNARSATAEPLTELSMGMSNDFEIAVEEGATWIRLGTVLVGKEEV